jgi:hypothetical protein
MRRQVVALTLLATLVGCDSRTPTRPDLPPDPAAEVSALSISGDSRFTELNEVHRLSATAQLVNGASRDVTAAATWSSSNLAVASVSSHGEVTSRGVGLATIFAEYSRVSSFDVAVAPMDRSRIAGLYRLSFTAASACAALPDWARHREYNATLDQPAEPTESGALLVLSVQLPGELRRVSKVCSRDHASVSGFGPAIPTRPLAVATRSSMIGLTIANSSPLMATQTARWPPPPTCGSPGYFRALFAQ